MSDDVTPQSAVSNHPYQVISRQNLFPFILLLSFFSAASIFVFLAFSGTLFSLVVVFVGGMPGIYSLVMISGCMANMFPLIYGLSLTGAKEELPVGGSCMIMAVLGGAVMTGVMGIVSDNAGIQVAFLVPLISYLYLIYFGFHCRRE